MKWYLTALALVAASAAIEAKACNCVGEDRPEFSIQQREQIVERVVEPVCEQRERVYVRQFSNGSSGCYGSAGGAYAGGNGGFSFRQRERFSDSGGFSNPGVAIAYSNQGRSDNNLGLALALREQNNRDRLAAFVALRNEPPRVERRGLLAAFRRPRVDNSLPNQLVSLSR